MITKLTKIYLIGIVVTVLNTSFIEPKKFHDGVFDVSSIKEEDCIFTDEAITDYFLRNNNNIHSYIWLDEEKKAYILLKNGDYVFVQQWACLTYGMKIVKVSTLPEYHETNIEYWQEDMLKLGEQFLDKKDFEDYKNAIQNDTWLKNIKQLKVNDRHKINIDHISYPKYYTTLERTESTVVTTIFYYMD